MASQLSGCGFLGTDKSRRRVDTRKNFVSSFTKLSGLKYQLKFQINYT